MELKREMIIRANGQIELRPSESDPQTRHINHARTLELLGSIITECEQDYKPKLIAIEGETESGKSVLAELLAETGNNTVLVSAGGQYTNPNKIPLPPIEKPTATFIFDEPNYVQDESLQSYIDAIAENNGIAVLLAQRISDYPALMTPHTSILMLTREGLNRIQ